MNRRDGAGVLVVAQSTGRVLLCQRADDIANGCTWSVFGGRVDGSEEPEEAAARELFEEAGIDIDGRELELIHERQKGKGGTYYTFVLVVSRENKPKINDESSDFGWFDIDDLPEPLHPGLEEMFCEVDVGELLDELLDE